MTVERITDNNFNNSSLDSFDTKLHVIKEYRKENDKYKLLENEHVIEWSLEEKRQAAEKLKSTKYISFAALQGGEVIGFLSFEKEPVDNRLIMDLFMVDAQYRGQDVGRKLFEAAIDEASELSADEIYISANPAEDLIAFYEDMEACVTDNPIKEMSDKDPLNIQMVIKL